jgi:uncharacterized protein (TIGR04255 family)
VDFRVANMAQLSAEKLGPLREQLKDRYPHVQERREKQAAFQMKEGTFTAEAKDLGFRGLFVSSSDQKFVAQFRQNGFTLNRLAPYIGGDALIAEALDLWPRYAAIARPEALIRLAVRYINRLELPFRPGDDLGKFLAASPDIPDALPQQVSDFLTRVALHDPSDQVTVIITQRMELPPSPGTSVPLILDVDVFKIEALSVKVEDLRPHFDVLRKFARTAFFAHVTEEAVNLYV